MAIWRRPRLDGLLDKAHGVHVLDLAAGAEVGEILGASIFLILAGRQIETLTSARMAAVLHVAVAGAQSSAGSGAVLAT